MRPSAAIRTAWSVTSAVTGSSGCLRADVVRLVDHDEHGLASVRRHRAFEHGLRGDGLLLARRQRAEIDDETARVASLDVVDERPLPPRAHSCRRRTPRFSALKPKRPRVRLFRRRQLFEGDASAPSSSSTSRTPRDRPPGRAASAAARALGSSWPRRSVKTVPGTPHETPFARRRSRQRAARRRCPRLAEPDVVGVRVEDDKAKVRLDEQPLQHEPERIRLAGARLAAQKRVTVEPAGVERRRHAGRKQQLADRAARSRRPNRLQPLGHLGGLGWACERVVERLAVAVEDDALAASRRGVSSASAARAAVAGGHLGASRPGPAPAPRSGRDGSVVAFEHDIAADLELEPVQSRPAARSACRRPRSRAEESTPRSSAATPKLGRLLF